MLLSSPKQLKGPTFDTTPCCSMILSISASLHRKYENEFDDEFGPVSRSTNAPPRPTGLRRPSSNTVRNTDEPGDVVNTETGGTVVGSVPSRRAAAAGELFVSPSGKLSSLAFLTSGPIIVLVDDFCCFVVDFGVSHRDRRSLLSARSRTDRITVTSMTPRGTKNATREP